MSTTVTTATAIMASGSSRPKPGIFHRLPTIADMKDRPIIKDDPMRFVGIGDHLAYLQKDNPKKYAKLMRLAKEQKKLVKQEFFAGVRK